jgi:NADPH-dependent 2,4-dienoyl-CoA reductase/sulfur reductase-like enzyme
VVGAGPAGLEAARVLAERGHRVTVFERAAEPGGQLRLSRLVPPRGELAALPLYLAGAVVRAGGELRLGVEATVDLVLGEAPDVVVVATGARPGMPPVAGILDSPAVDPFAVLRRATGRPRRALVMGGGILGVGVAHVLGERGIDVVVTEAGPELAAELGLRPRWQYVAGLRARPNVTVHLETTVERLSGATALLRRRGEEIMVDGLDLVVPTRPLLAESELGTALKAVPDGPPVFEIGDCAQPRTAFEAMQEGAALGHRL